jgi:2,4-dienoyl-CoA reductase-like NADH-dependent reductase (Old Yellow Enzyme family)
VLPNGVIIKNRLESTPSGLHFLQGPEHHPNEAVIQHYINRAKSGAGIVVVT